MVCDDPFGFVQKLSNALGIGNELNAGGCQCDPSPGAMKKRRADFFLKRFYSCGDVRLDGVQHTGRSSNTVCSHDRVEKFEIDAVHQPSPFLMENI
jgi:hypothetical protein